MTVTKFDYDRAKGYYCRSRDYTVSKFFSVSKYDKSWRKARTAAYEFKNLYNKENPDEIKPRDHFVQKKKRTKTQVVIGVREEVHNNKHKFWVVSLPGGPTGKRKSYFKYFSTSKWGERGAKRNAMTLRKEYIASLKQKSLPEFWMKIDSLIGK